jgi:tetratricopeptide (TPR) repeat protein
MKKLPVDTCSEFEHRLDINMRMRSAFDPTRSIPERKAWAHSALAGSYFDKGVTLQLLGNIDEAEEAFTQVIPEAKNAIACDFYENEDYRQYALFFYALLLCDKAQADESAVIISKLGASQSRLNAPSEVYLALANLWLEKTDTVQMLLPEIKRIEEKKNEKYIKAGFTTVLSGLLEGKMSDAIKGMNELIDGHKHEAKYMKIALQHPNFICQQATVLCVLALKLGLDLKSEVQGINIVLKTKMEAPMERPEIPEKTKFEVPVDLIPEWILAPWRKKLKNELNN